LILGKNLDFRFRIQESSITSLWQQYSIPGEIEMDSLIVMTFSLKKRSTVARTTRRRSY